MIQVLTTSIHNKFLYRGYLIVQFINKVLCIYKGSKRICQIEMTELGSTKDLQKTTAPILDMIERNI